MSEHDELSRALRAMPRVRASADFEARVLAELARRRGFGLTGARSGQLALAAVVLISAGVGWWAVERAQEPTAPTRVVRAEQAAAELAALRVEMAALRANLDELQRPAAPTVFAVPGDARRDVVVDMRPVSFRPGGGAPPLEVRQARFERFMEVTP
jgi:hypothetical protein